MADEFANLNRRRQQRRLTTILAPNVAHEKGRIVVDAAFLSDSLSSHTACQIGGLFMTKCFYWHLAALAALQNLCCYRTKADK
jgi:hypothetical protein